MSKNKYKNNAPANKNFRKPENEEPRPDTEKPVQNQTARGDPQEMKAGPEPQNDPIPEPLDHQVTAPSMQPGSAQRADLMDTAQGAVRPTAGFTETNSIPAGGLGEFNEQLRAQGVPEEAIARESTPDPGALEPGADKTHADVSSSEAPRADHDRSADVRAEGTADAGAGGEAQRMDTSVSARADRPFAEKTDANTYEQSETTAGRRIGDTAKPSDEHSEYTAVPLENQGRRAGFPWWWILLPLLILALLYGLTRQPAAPQTPPSSTNGQVPVGIILADLSQALDENFRF